MHTVLRNVWMISVYVRFYKNSVGFISSALNKGSSTLTETVRRQRFYSIFRAWQWGMSPNKEADQLQLDFCRKNAWVLKLWSNRVTAVRRLPLNALTDTTSSAFIAQHRLKAKCVCLSDSGQSTKLSCNFSLLLTLNYLALIFYFLTDKCKAHVDVNIFLIPSSVTTWPENSPFT